MSLPPRYSVNPSPFGDDEENEDFNASLAAGADQRWTGHSMPSVVGEGGVAKQSKPSRKILAIGAPIGLVLALGGGGLAYAAMSAAGTQLYSAVPASAFAYAEIDLDPSMNQKLAYQSLSEANPEIFKPATDEDGPLSIKEDLAQEIEGEYVYATDVEPWMGDKVAGAAWSDEGGQVVNTIVYQVKNKDALQASLSKFTNVVVSEDQKFVYVVGDSATTVTGESISEKVQAEGSLLSSDEFAKAKDSVSDNRIAFAWVDGQSAAKSNPLYEEIYGDLGSKAPSAVATVSLNNTGVVVDALYSAENNFYQSAPSDLSRIQDMRNGTVVLGVSNSDKILAQTWKMLQEASPEMLQSVEQELSTRNIKLPDDATDLVGTSLYGSVDINTSAVEVVTPGANIDKIKPLYDEALSQSQLSSEDLGLALNSGTGPDGKEEISYVVGSSDKGLVKDNPQFKEVVGDVSDSSYVAYINVDEIYSLYGAYLSEYDESLAINADEPKPYYGAVGINSKSIDEKTTSVKVIWDATP